MVSFLETQQLSGLIAAGDLVYVRFECVSASDLSKIDAFSFSDEASEFCEVRGIETSGADMLVRLLSAMKNACESAIGSLRLSPGW